MSPVRSLRIARCRFVPAWGRGRGPGADCSSGAGQQPGRDDGDVGAGPARRALGGRGFRRLVSRDGCPGISPAQLATVSVLQFLLDLSGRDAAEAVRCRINFKYALGPELDDPVALYGSLGVSGRGGGWLRPPPGGGGGLWPVLPGLFAV